jgi:hypothetical protein
MPWITWRNGLLLYVRAGALPCLACARGSAPAYFLALPTTALPPLFEGAGLRGRASLRRTPVLCLLFAGSLTQHGEDG